MPRIARVVVPGLPHHVTQRGNRRMPVFFSDNDYLRYRDLVAEFCAAAKADIWAYCLMPNHVHFIMVPGHEDSLRAGLAEAHRRYSLAINRRNKWTGYLWQGRFASFPMDNRHTVACARYIELNPVRAKLVRRVAEWPWSSAKAHVAGKDDALVRVRPLLDEVSDWRAFLDEDVAAAEFASFRRASRSGRPVGTDRFIETLERKLGRPLKPGKVGRPSARTTGEEP
jgi:putative transposase